MKPTTTITPTQSETATRLLLENRNALLTEGIVASRLFDVLTESKGVSLMTPKEYVSDLTDALIDYASQIMTASASAGESVLQESVNHFEFMRQMRDTLQRQYRIMQEAEETAEQIRQERAEAGQKGGAPCTK